MSLNTCTICHLLRFDVDGNKLQTLELPWTVRTNERTCGCDQPLGFWDMARYNTLLLVNAMASGTILMLIVLSK